MSNNNIVTLDLDDSGFIVNFKVTFYLKIGNIIHYSSQRTGTLLPTVSEVSHIILLRTYAISLPHPMQTSVLNTMSVCPLVCLSHMHIYTE